MTQPKKIWKKCVATRTLTDYTTTPPSVREWIESETTYDEDEDVMIFKEFDQDSILIREKIQYDDISHFIDYNKNGEIVSEEVVENTKNDEGNFEMSSIDSDDNLKEDKLEYDEKDRCVKKSFLENGKVNSWLEFQYDEQDRVIKMSEYENDKLNFYEEDIYVSDEESFTLRYDRIGQLKMQTEYKKLSDRNTFVNFYYDDQGILLKKIEEERDNNDNVIAQRIYGANNALKIETIFGPDNENGFRTYLAEHIYKDLKLLTEVTTKYEYSY